MTAPRKTYCSATLMVSHIKEFGGKISKKRRKRKCETRWMFGPKVFLELCTSREPQQPRVTRSLPALFIARYHIDAENDTGS